MTFSIRAHEWPRCSRSPIRRWNWFDAVQVGHEGQRVRALAGGADAGGLPVGDVIGQGEPVGVQVVDTGDGAVGADADGILTTDVDGVVEVRDDAGCSGVPVRVEEGHEVDAHEAATLGHQAEFLTAAQERAAALADGDAERLSGLLHREFRWTSHVGETYDRAEYVRRNTEGHTVWRSQELGNTDVVVVGDVQEADDTGVGARGRYVAVPRWARRTTARLGLHASSTIPSQM